MISKISVFNNWILDLIFPKHCLGCNREGLSICSGCTEKLGIVNNPIDYEIEELSELISIALYRDRLWQEVLQNLKYDFNIDISSALDKVFEKTIIDHPEIKDFEFDAVIPVPLHKKRFLERGFNQAEVIAKKISKQTGWPLVNDKVIRIKNTSPQAKFDDDARRENVRRAFQVREKEFFKNKNIILVDDVFTTGSTLFETAAAIMESGAQKVSAWVVTRRSKTA